MYCFDLARLSFHLISSRPRLILLFTPREVPFLLHPSFWRDGFQNIYLFLKLWEWSIHPPFYIWLFGWWTTSPCAFICKQECIPVGCVPAARWPYAGVCFPGGSLLRGVVCSRGGVCSRRLSAPGGCLLPGVCSRGAVCSRGVVSQHALRQTPPPRGQNHRRL